jgi:hypothetical protein
MEMVQTLIRVLEKIFGLATMFVLYGTLMVRNGGQFGIQANTFPMFACFIATVVGGFGIKTDKARVLYWQRRCQEVHRIGLAQKRVMG